MEFYMSTLGENQQEKDGSLLQRTVTALKIPIKKAERIFKERTYGWGTGLLEDSFTAFFYLNGSKRRTPGYNLRDKDGELLGDTCEFVHPVVGFRKQQIPSYSPLGRGTKYERRKTVDECGCRSIVYNLGDARKELPEWRLGGLDSYERLFIASKAAYDYVDEVDLYLETGVKTPRRSVWGVRDIDLGIELPTITSPNARQSVDTGSKSDTAQESALGDKRAEWSVAEAVRDEQLTQ